MQEKHMINHGELETIAKDFEKGAALISSSFSRLINISQIIEPKNEHSKERIIKTVGIKKFALETGISEPEARRLCKTGVLPCNLAGSGRGKYILDFETAKEALFNHLNKNTQDKEPQKGIRPVD